MRSKRTRGPFDGHSDLELFKELKKIDKELERRGCVIVDHNAAVAVKPTRPGIGHSHPGDNNSGIKQQIYTGCLFTLQMMDKTVSQYGGSERIKVPSAHRLTPASFAELKINAFTEAAHVEECQQCLEQIGYSISLGGYETAIGHAKDLVTALEKLVPVAQKNEKYRP